MFGLLFENMIGILKIICSAHPLAMYFFLGSKEYAFFERFVVLFSWVSLEF